MTDQKILDYAAAGRLTADSLRLLYPTNTDYDLARKALMAFGFKFSRREGLWIKGSMAVSPEHRLETILAMLGHLAVKG